MAQHLFSGVRVRGFSLLKSTQNSSSSSSCQRPSLSFSNLSVLKRSGEAEPGRLRTGTGKSGGARAACQCSARKTQCSHPGQPSGAGRELARGGGVPTAGTPAGALGQGWEGPLWKGSPANSDSTLGVRTLAQGRGWQQGWCTGYIRGVDQRSNKIKVILMQVRTLEK